MFGTRQPVTIDCSVGSRVTCAEARHCQLAASGRCQMGELGIHMSSAVGGYYNGKQAEDNAVNALKNSITSYEQEMQMKRPRAYSGRPLNCNLSASDEICVLKEYYKGDKFIEESLTRRSRL